MRLPYQFNDKSDPEDYRYGYTAETLLSDHVNNDRRGYGYSNRKGIEEQISTITEAIGGLADLLISKGVFSPQDFLAAINAENIYEVRERKD